MARMDYDLTVLGGGSGGLTAARTAASLGARVLLIEKERLGGDCLYTGCVPSKSLIHVAQVIHQARTATHLGLTTNHVDIDMAQVANYIQEVIKRVQEAEHVYTDNATVKFGVASFQSPTTLMVNAEKITSRATIIATGSYPAHPRIEGLAEVGYLTNEDVFQLTHLPASLLIVGGGPVGVELGQALARLGVQVTLVQGPERILPREDPDVSEAIAHVLQAEGVTLVTKARVLKAEQQGGKKRITAKQDEQFVTQVFYLSKEWRTMKRERRRPNPVWLVFVTPGLARGWLLFHMTTDTDGAFSWLILAVNASLLLALSVLTWFFAADLADAAGLWQRAKERFLVMAALSALAPPLSIAVAQTSHWGRFTAVEVVSLWGLRVSFRLLSRRPARVVRRERWYAWVFSCLLSALGLWLIRSAFAATWPLDSRSWLALSIPRWPTADLALLPLSQLWVVVVCVCGVLLAIGSSFLSFWWQHPLFLQLRKLVGVSLLFSGALVGVGALMWIMHIALDGYIYILQAFALTIPVCNAAFFALPYIMMEHRTGRLARQGRGRQSSGLPVEKGAHHGGYGVILHTTFLAILSLYFWSQLSTYMTTGPTPR